MLYPAELQAHYTANIRDTESENKELSLLDRL
jgi:hypothetical protein